MTNHLTVEILHSLTPFHPDGHDLVTKASSDLLLSCIKCEPGVHKVFFPNFEPPPALKLVEYRTFPIDMLSTAFMAETISKIKDPYNFHKIINKHVVEDQLKEVYESLHWKKLG